MQTRFKALGSVFPDTEMTKYSDQVLFVELFKFCYVLSLFEPLFENCQLVAPVAELGVGYNADETFIELLP